MGKGVTRRFCLQGFANRVREAALLRASGPSDEDRHQASRQ